MAWSATATSVYFRNQTHICTVACLDNDAPSSQAFTFAGAGMGDMTRDPREVELTKVGSGADVETGFMVTAMSRTGFTLRKLTAGGAGGLVTLRLRFK
jgi:hypothetical protein